MPTAYKSQKAKASDRQRQKTREGQDIGKLPRVMNPRRKKKCRASLRAFCDSYLKARFQWAWCADHLKMIAKLETAVLKGGMFTFAMPRGSGKTSLAEAAAIWALLYGFRHYVLLVAARADLAEKILKSIRDEFELNELLLADFPEVCYPIAKLEGEARRCGGQHIGGKKTYVKWTQKQLVLPTVAKSPASGSVVEVAGIEGGIRGPKHRRSDGSTIRPDFVIPDDPQTDESAKHRGQVEFRERIIEGAILRLSGPKVKIAAVMPLTVIYPGDLADRYLSKSIHPEWSSERAKMIYSFPENMKLWDQYDEERRAGLMADDGGERGTAFYGANREEMDRGAAVGWEERDEPGCLSALQFAMNWYYGSRRSFMAEAQNEPMVDLIEGQLPDLDPAAIAKRVNNAGRGEVPPGTTRLGAFVDVQKHALFWCVCGWAEGFANGAVIDYGVYPKQNSEYFAYNDIRESLTKMPEYKDFDDTARVYASVRKVTDELLSRSFGGQMIDLALVDAGWETDTVHRCCRESTHGTRLLPSMGYGIGAKALPMALWPKKDGEKRDPSGGWVIYPRTGSGRGRQVTIDTNRWKSFAAQRLATPAGGRGSLMLFGTDPREHRLFCDHLTAEYRVETEGRGRKLHEWSQRPGRPDNHWLDCLVGCCVAVSVQGLIWSPGGVATPQPKSLPPMKRHSEIQRERLAR